MLQLRNLHPGVVLVLPGDTQILHNVVRLSCKRSVDVHSLLGVRLRQFEEVTCDTSQLEVMTCCFAKVLPRMLIRAWLSAWKRARRSRTRSRKTVIVISFSGSFSIT